MHHEDLSSDITRTIVFGADPTKRQGEIWKLEQEAQAAGFAAAKIGAPCEEVDAAARKVITDAGFGPGYKLPGLPHRTGHGIGMDGHEWGNMVKGNKQALIGNVCLGEGGANAGPFWVNRDGWAVMTPADLTFLSSLYLRNAIGGDFNPATTKAFSNWLARATTNNMAYALSAQLAAMQLNVRHNYVNGSALVYAPALLLYRRPV